MIKKVLLCLAVLIACMQFNSCGKETDGIPPAIQRLIDNGYCDNVYPDNGYAIKPISVDEFKYNGDVVYLCSFVSYRFVYEQIITSEGFIIGEAYPGTSPIITTGCYDHFKKNSQFIRHIK